MIDQKNILLALKGAYREARILQLAADTCAANFEWLKLNRRQGRLLRPIYLLDFDTIASAVRTLTAVKLARIGEKRDRNASPVPFAFHELLGPYTMDLICRNLKDFSLPLGTIKELQECKQRIHTHAGRSTVARLVTEPHITLESIKILFRENTSDKFTYSLRNELEVIFHARDDIALLEHLLANGIRIETLISEPIEESSMFLHKAYSQLQKARPGRSDNNYCDALNLLALIFISEKPPDTSPTPVPFLISQTEEIAKLGKLANRWLDRGDDLAQLNDPTYLMIATQLSMIAGDDDDYTISQAQLLARRARTVADTHVLAFRAMEERKILPDEYDAPEWRLVQLRMDAFRRQLAETLPGFPDAVTFDRVGHQNLLFSKQLDEVFACIGGENRSQLVSGFQKLRTLLAQTAETDKILKSLVFERVDCQHELSISTDWLFNFSYSAREEVAGRPLSQTPIGNYLLNGKSPCLPLNQSLRICAHDRLGILRGAVIAIDTLLQGKVEDEIRASILWRHTCEVAMVWAEAMKLFFSYSVATRLDSRYEVKLFYQGESISRDYSIEPDFHVPEEIRSLMNVIEYFELTSNGVTFFADVVPIQKLEMQCGCIFGTNVVTMPFCKSLARALHATLEVSIPESYLAKTVFWLLNLLPTQNDSKRPVLS